MSKYLSADADIVHNKAFESAFVKIVNKNESQLNSSESFAASGLNLENTDDIEIGDDGMCYFKKLDTKRRRLSIAKTQFIKCDCILATSCSVDRLFSAARRVLTTLRKRMSPILFEAIFFLKLNRKLWNLKSVASAIKSKPQNRYIDLDDDLFYEK